MDRKILMTKISGLRDAVQTQEIISRNFCTAQSMWYQKMMDAIASLLAECELLSSVHDQAAVVPPKEKPNTSRERPAVLTFPAPAGFYMPVQHCPQTGEEPEAAPIEPVLAPEGTPLPDGIADLRPLLRRDGLILLSWRQLKTVPRTYDVFWVARTSRRRIYSALSIPEIDLGKALPNTANRFNPFIKPHCRISYFANILQWVYVAPREIIEEGPDPRPKYIENLEAMGIDIGSDAKFSITEQRKQVREKRSSHQASLPGSASLPSSARRSM